MGSLYYTDSIRGLVVNSSLGWASSPWANMFFFLLQDTVHLLRERQTKRAQNPPQDLLAAFPKPRAR